jgi:hypothetical protein
LRSVGDLAQRPLGSPLEARADDTFELLATLAFEVGYVGGEAEDPLLGQHALDERADVLVGVADSRKTARDLAEGVEEANERLADGEAERAVLGAELGRGRAAECAQDFVVACTSGSACVSTASSRVERGRETSETHGRGSTGP